ncbi:sensor histidine kinase [Fervidibacillus halotolerans]|uniref:histidine kinase n=1 Tax=Fervidibacillus halotolerans TaxID=2980027 RepID=A0A9E8RYV8_9BACI|nr:histidine kinase [Fervidibacillus halotolerans]WAA12663.1 histidine kinase [Fervidibacillus halotolerans]
MKIFHNNGLKWLGLLLFISIPLISLFLVERQVNPLENAFKSTSGDFQYMDNDGVWRDYDPVLFEGVKVTGTYWFKTVLPENRWRDPYMYLRFVPNAEIYLDNELIYTFSPPFEYWEHPHLIKLPDDFSSQTLMIRIDFDRQWMYPGLIIIDSPLNIIIHQLLQSDDRLLLGFVSLLVGIGGFILYIGRRQPSYLYFSLFALYIVQLCLSRSWNLLGLLTSSPAFPYFQDVILPIGGYFFWRFYEHLFGKNASRIGYWVAHVTLVIFVLWLVMSLFFPSFYSYEMSVLLQNIIIPALIIIILISALQAYRNRRDTETFWLMAGVVTFGLAVLMYFLLPYIAWVTDSIVPQWFRFSIIYNILFEGDRFLHGLFILLFSMGMVLNANIRSVYQKLQKTAKELTQLSNSLERLVQERTKELEQTNRNLRSSMQKTAEALAEIAVLEDRNRIAQDMHDRTGHALTAALIQIEAAKRLMKKDVGLALEKLEATRESVASGLDSIRETVRMMKHDYEERSLVLSIQKLIQETETAVGVQIIYDPQPLPELDPITKKTLYLALQEGLTNGIRHGNATQFDFSLKVEGDIINFQLANNGEVYNGQEFGFGLNSMRERIERLNGTMHLEATDLHPCVLRITLPIESNDDEKEGTQ